MIKPDTPFALMLEMHAVVLAVPILVLLAAAAMLVAMRPWRSSSFAGVAFKVAMGGSVVALAALIAWGAFLVGFGTLLEHPRYHGHIVCEPCF